MNCRPLYDGAGIYFWTAAVLMNALPVRISSSDIKASGLSAVDHIVRLRLLGLDIQLDFLEISGILLQVKLPNILSNLDELLKLMRKYAIILQFHSK